jgi:hypothetical protein
LLTAVYRAAATRAHRRLASRGLHISLYGDATR